MVDNPRTAEVVLPVVFILFAIIRTLGLSESRARSTDPDRGSIRGFPPMDVSPAL